MRHAPLTHLGNRYNNLRKLVCNKPAAGSGVLSMPCGCFCLLVLVLLSYVTLSFASSYELDMQEAAQQGDATSQYGLALLYEFGGEQLPKEPQKALGWFEAAADKGVAGACFYLGLKYEYGNRVPRDLEKAACLYNCAARQDWPAAQYFLARMYEQGKGVGQSTILALAWYQFASQWQYPEAAGEFSRLFSSSAFNDMDSLRKIQEKLFSDTMAPCR